MKLMVLDIDILRLKSIFMFFEVTPRITIYS